jgi:hypothetical protein
MKQQTNDRNAMSAFATRAKREVAPLPEVEQKTRLDDTVELVWCGDDKTVVFERRENELYCTTSDSTGGSGGPCDENDVLRILRDVFKNFKDFSGDGGDGG